MIKSSSVNPDALEFCNGIDDDCDLSIDTEAVDQSTYYIDADEDGFGNPVWPTEACEQPSGYSNNSMDCNDADPSINPGVLEICDSNNIDEDCDGLADNEDASAEGQGLYFVDADGDWHGSTLSAAFCDAPAGYVSSSDDCDDSNPSINPEEDEICNDGLDNDCDNTVGDCVIQSGNINDITILFYGEAEGNGAGTSVARAGDVNGDGFDDILIGSSFYGANTEQIGAAHLVLGSANPATSSLATVGIRFDGAEAQDRAGYSVAGIGDINGDGFNDLLVGTPENDEWGLDTGTAYLILGSSAPAALSLEDADAQFWGEYVEDYAGWSMAGAGDFNGDGLSDFLVGAPCYEQRSLNGAAYLLLGSPEMASMPLSSASARFTGEAEDDNAGSSIAEAGDINGDGLDDVLVGAPSYDTGGSDIGAAYLILGKTNPNSDTLAAADAYFTGEAEGDQAGRSVSDAGDVNGDGFGDLLIGALYYDSNIGTEGAAYLVLGSASPASGALSIASARFTGEDSGDFAGNSVAGPGDINQDGFDDMLVGAFFHDNLGVHTTGAAYLVLGEASPSSLVLDDAAASWKGNESEYAGNAVAGAGDFNQDGFVDFLVAAWQGDYGTLNSGTVGLVLGMGL